MHSAIVVVVDGLRPEYLGPYGNAWVSTPHLNRLAAEGFVFDHCVAAEQDASKLFRSLLTGQHPSLVSRKAPPQPSASEDEVQMTAPLLQWVRKNGGAGLFVTDDPRLFRDSAAQWFDTLQLLSGQRIEAQGADSWEAILAGLPPNPCLDWSETWTAGFFSQVSDLLPNVQDRAFLLWCHLGGFARIWDCPTDFREVYQEEGDPPPWNGVAAPRHFFPPGADPDSWLPFVQAYAGQVVLLDLCLGGLLQAISQAGLDRQCVIALTGFGGFPLAEHGWLGMWKIPPRNERIACPLMLRFPDGVGAADRSHALCYVHDLAPTLQAAIADPADPPAPGSPDSRSTTGRGSPACPGESPAFTSCDTDGGNLMPIVHGQIEQVRDRLFCRCDDPAVVAVRTASWSALVDMTADLQSFDKSLPPPATRPAEPASRAFASGVNGAEDTALQEVNAEAELGNDSQDVTTVRGIVELYVKPDDRWEMNDVADRCPREAVAAIRQALAFHRLVKGDLSALPPLETPLTERA
ncbi:MAG: sulfatase-like hydrolase/transferase [Thermogutta sp.]